jgi:hypothetical protein
MIFHQTVASIVKEFHYASDDWIIVKGWWWLAEGTYSLMWDSNQGGSPHRNIVDFDIGEMKNDAEIG